MHGPATAASKEPAPVRLLGRLIFLVNGLATALSAIGILASLALIVWSVVMRYIFNRPPLWVDEVVGFLLVAIVMLATADVLRKGEHIGVDLLTTRLGPKGMWWARAWASLTSLAAALILVFNGWESAMFSRMLGVVTEGHLELPVFWFMLLLPLGGLLMLLTSLEALARLATGCTSLAVPSHEFEDPA